MFTWTREKQGEALNGHFYFDAATEDEHVLLKDKDEIWEEDPTFIYIPSLRIAGSVEDLLKLSESGVIDKEDLQTYIADSYSFEDKDKPDIKAKMQLELDEYEIFSKQ